MISGEEAGRRRWSTDKISCLSCNVLHF